MSNYHLDNSTFDNKPFLLYDNQENLDKDNRIPLARDDIAQRLLYNDNSVLKNLVFVFNLLYLYKFLNNLIYDMQLDDLINFNIIKNK